MTKKRLIVIFSIFLVLVVLIVLNSTVFTVQNAEVSLYNEQGKEILNNSDIMPSQLIRNFIGSNIFFLDESKLIADIQSMPEYYNWQVVSIERSFPNTVRLHMSERFKIFYLDFGGAGLAVDVNGCVVSNAELPRDNYIDISYLALSIDKAEAGHILTFKDEQAVKDFQIIKNMTNTIWQLNFDYDEIHTLLDSYTIDNNVLTLSTRTGAKIVIEEADKNLTVKLANAYGVYSNSSIDMTAQNVVITVHANGSITSTNDN